MRVFAAIPLPRSVVDDLRGRIDAVAAEMAADEGALRWTPPDAWHLTLAFFGTMTDDDVLDLRRRLRQTAGRHSGLGVQLAGSGHFGRHVLWAGVSGDRDQLRRLARSVAAAGRRAGADIDEHARYRPHVTVARAPSPRRGESTSDAGPSRATISAAVDRIAGYRGPPWTASTFTLVRSDLGAGPRGRSRHTILETFELTGRPPTTARVPDSGPSRGPTLPDQGETRGRR